MKKSFLIAAILGAAMSSSAFAVDIIPGFKTSASAGISANSLSHEGHQTGVNLGVNAMKKCDHNENMLIGGSVDYTIFDNDRNGNLRGHVANIISTEFQVGYDLNHLGAPIIAKAGVGLGATIVDSHINWAKHYSFAAETPVYKDIAAGIKYQIAGDIKDGVDMTSRSTVLYASFAF